MGKAHSPRAAGFARAGEEHLHRAAQAEEPAQGLWGRWRITSLPALGPLLLTVAHSFRTEAQKGAKISKELKEKKKRKTRRLALEFRVLEPSAAAPMVQLQRDRLLSAWVLPGKWMRCKLSAACLRFLCLSCLA